MQSLKSFFALPDEESTLRLGRVLADWVRPGFVLFLEGDLGAGKSTLTRGILRALGVRGAMRSPSYALVEPYDVQVLHGGTLYHFDFYRLHMQPKAWKEAGFVEAFEAPNAAIVEWAQYAEGLPVPVIKIELLVTDNSRVANVNVLDMNYIDLFSALKERM